jgi:hypothetical protein
MLPAYGGTWDRQRYTANVIGEVSSSASVAGPGFDSFEKGGCKDHRRLYRPPLIGVLAWGGGFHVARDLLAGGEPDARL